MLREVLSDLKLRRRFQAYVRRRRFVSQLFLLLLTRNFFFPSFPYEKYGRNYLNLHLE